jgi:hypothetical protein
VTCVGVSLATSVYYASIVTVICGELVLLSIFGSRASEAHVRWYLGPVVLFNQNRILWSHVSMLQQYAVLVPNPNAVLMLEDICKTKVNQQKKSPTQSQHFARRCSIPLAASSTPARGETVRIETWGCGCRTPS